MSSLTPHNFLKMDIALFGSKVSTGEAGQFSSMGEIILIQGVPVLFSKPLPIDEAHWNVLKSKGC